MAHQDLKELPGRLLGAPEPRVQLTELDTDVGLLRSKADRPLVGDGRLSDEAVPRIRARATHMFTPQSWEASGSASWYFGYAARQLPALLKQLAHLELTPGRFCPMGTRNLDSEKPPVTLTQGECQWQYWRTTAPWGWERAEGTVSSGHGPESSFSGWPSTELA
jgi:hypothetical protein